jgi:threonine dehydrogenase-like Zn-dependent dehydrogenase
VPQAQFTPIRARTTARTTAGSTSPTCCRRPGRRSRTPRCPTAGRRRARAGIARPLLETAGVDRLNALYTAIDLVRRGGTISVYGVYGGSADPVPMLTLFDKQVQLRMGQANVKRWVPEIMPLLTDGDPPGVDTFATHRLSLDDAPGAYETFQKKEDGCVKVLLTP